VVPASQRLRGGRAAGLVVGSLLLIAALVMVWRQRPLLIEAIESIPEASPHLVAMLVAAVVANVVLSGLLFSVLMSRYGRVGLLEMQALIAASALLNFVPLRPGLFGRLAYHRAVNGIAPALAARTVLQALALSSGLGAYLAVVALAARGLDASPWWGVMAPGPILAMAAVHPKTRLWSTAVLLRYLDLLVWSVRYHASFALLGRPLDYPAALALACVGVVATLVPFLSNGLGLREWAVGLFGPLLGGYRLSLGLAAELMNRAAEILVFLVLGLAGMASVARRIRSRDRR
jgi:hypothetical protein